MSTILTIDQGNTCTKATIISSRSVVESLHIDKLTPEAVLPLIEHHNPEGAIYCSVAKVDARFTESLRLLLTQQIVKNHSTPIHKNSQK